MEAYPMSIPEIVHPLLTVLFQERPFIAEYPAHISRWSIHYTPVVVIYSNPDFEDDAIHVCEIHSRQYGMAVSQQK